MKALHNNFSVLGESADMVDTIIDNHVVLKTQELSRLIMSIHYTDQKLFSDYPGHIRAVFYALPKN